MAKTGLKILTTRPEAFAERLVLPLQQAGYQVVNQPLLALQPLELKPQQQQWLLDLDNFQRVVVVSPSAVVLLLEHLENYWPQWPVGIAWYTVGQGSQLSLAQAGIQASYPTTGDTSEDLLQHQDLQQLKGEKVLLVKGLGGRDLLKDTLSARGARVSVLHLYARVLPQLDKSAQYELLHGEQEVLVVTSGDALHNYVQLVKAEFTQQQQLTQALSRRWLIVPSARVAQQAQALGFTRVVSSAGAGAAAIVTAIQKLPNLPS